MSNIIFTGIIDIFLYHYGVRLSCKMFRFIIIGFVLACASAQFPYSVDEKIKCVIEYYQNEGSIISTQRALQTKYNFRTDVNTIKRYVRNFETYRNVEKIRDARERPI